MRKAVLAAFIFAVAHALACLWMIPRANAAYQWWFDTGEPMSRVEIIGRLAALTLSSPVAVWTLTLHPSRVSAEALAISVVANSSLWAVCLFLILVWLRRMGASNIGMHPTADARVVKFQ